MIKLSSDILGLAIHKEASGNYIKIDYKTDYKNNRNFLVRPLWYYPNTKMLTFKYQKDAIKYGLYLFKIQQLTKND